MAADSATTASYDSIADWYDDWLGDGRNAHGDPFFMPLLDLIGDVAGLRICDLACGQGRVSRALADLGAQVTGVDASAEMLQVGERYRRAVDDDRIQFRQDDAHVLSSCQDAEFDGVICNMAMMDIPDLTATVRSVFRVLRPGGWFVFSTLHPCFNAPRSAEWIDDHGRSHRTVTDYFTEGFWQSVQRLGPVSKVGAYHRTLTSYLNTMITTGFVLREVQELAAAAPIWQEVPPVLAMIADKPAA
ncbi:MAG TPA: class I SAM-dependent methyltransferase [Microlunatus sp.]